jgi:hypothetical protein
MLKMKKRRFESKLIWLFHWNRYKYGIWTDRWFCQVFVIIKKIWLHITYKLLIKWLIIALCVWFADSIAIRLSAFFFLFFHSCLLQLMSVGFYKHFMVVYYWRQEPKKGNLCLFIYIFTSYICIHIYSLLPISSIIWIKGTAIGGGVKLIRTLYLPPPASSFQCIIYINYVYIIYKYSECLIESTP